MVAQSYWLVPSENFRQIFEIMRPVHEAAMDLSEEEIDNLIDEALDEVRNKKPDDLELPSG